MLLSKRNGYHRPTKNEINDIGKVSALIQHKSCKSNIFILNVLRFQNGFLVQIKRAINRLSCIACCISVKVKKNKNILSRTLFLTYLRIYIYTHVCVCVCVCVLMAMLDLRKISTLIKPELIG